MRRDQVPDVRLRGEAVQQHDPGAAPTPIDEMKLQAVGIDELFLRHIIPRYIIFTAEAQTLRAQYSLDNSRQCSIYVASTAFAFASEIKSLTPILTSRPRWPPLM